MSFSRGGSTRTETTQETNNVSAPVNLQDTEGVAAGSVGGDLVVNETDAGAVRDALDFADESLSRAANTILASNDTVRDISSGALNYSADVAEEAFGFARNAQTDAINFGGIAAKYISESARLAVETNERSTERAFSYFDRLSSEALDFVRDTTGDLQKQSLSQVGSTVEALNKIAVDNKKSTDARVADIASNAIKYGVIGLAVLALAFALTRRG